MAKFEYKVFECRIIDNEKDKTDFPFEVLVDEKWVDADEIGEQEWELMKFVKHPTIFRRISKTRGPNSRSYLPISPTQQEQEDKIKLWCLGLFKREKY